LTYLHCDPQNSSITFLPIPDNTMLQDGQILQSMYSIGRPSELISNLENMTGAIVNRYLFFTVESLAELVDAVGTFDYLIRYPFSYNSRENSGNVKMTAELTKAMFTYKDYDMSKVSLSNIGEYSSKPQLASLICSGANLEPGL
jgi:anionic cell wall polymer biosynthesis LytR-Cps2A-Psr (LCP) family protein